MSFHGPLHRPLLVGLLVLAVTPLACSAPRATIEEEHPVTVAVRKGIESGGERFDHSAYDRLLREHVRDTGAVDYSGLREDRPALGAYLRTLGEADLTRYGRDELLALIINAYNAFTLDWIVENLPLRSIRDTDDPWKAARHRFAGETVSLDFLEHSILRVPALFDEPRIHFGVNCASLGCPPLRNRAYTGPEVRAQLEAATRSALARPAHLRVDGERVLVNKIFDWFGEDFRREGNTLSAFLIPRAPEGAAAVLREGGDAAIGFLPYDWSLSDVAPAASTD